MRLLSYSGLNDYAGAISRLGAVYPHQLKSTH